jgi:hypothetical protein
MVMFCLVYLPSDPFGSGSFIDTKIKNDMIETFRSRIPVAVLIAERKYVCTSNSLDVLPTLPDPLRYEPIQSIATKYVGRHLKCTDSGARCSLEGFYFLRIYIYCAGRNGYFDIDPIQGDDMFRNS